MRVAHLQQAIVGPGRAGIVKPAGKLHSACPDCGAGVGEKCWDLRQGKDAYPRRLKSAHPARARSTAQQ